MQDKINTIIKDLEEKCRAIDKPEYSSEEEEKEAQDKIREYSIIMRIFEEVLLIQKAKNDMT